MALSPDIGSYFLKLSALENDTRLFVDGTEIAVHNQPVITDNLYHPVRIQRDGIYIRVWYDGTPVFDIADSTHLVGTFSIGTFNDDTYFDDIQMITDTDFIRVTSPNSA